MSERRGPAAPHPSQQGTTAFIVEARRLVSAKNVIVGSAATLRYRTSYRGGIGEASCVIKPRTLLQFWRVLQLCVDFDRIIIIQAANTGLTGGSTPSAAGYDREVVLINTMALAGVHLMHDGEQAVCLPGSTLYELETLLAPLGREPHSLIGSSCIGASVVGGVCNNSGGALIRRGPAYTEHAMFARLEVDGKIRLVNNLGIDIGTNPEEMLARLEAGDFDRGEAGTNSACRCSDHEYGKRIREIEADAPVRFNADPGRLYEASGSAGKVAIFAVRVDSFPKESSTTTFYIGTNEPTELATLRRAMLAQASELPISAEYIHRDAFDLAADYGKDIFLAVQYLGTARLRRIFGIKAVVDRLASLLGRFGAGFSDRAIQWISGFWPQHLPDRMMQWRDRYEHHLLLKVSAGNVSETLDILASLFPSKFGDYFVCTEEEQTKAFLHRFAVAGAAVRYRDVHSNTVGDLVTLDIALKANDREWREQLPPEIDQLIDRALYYGHFFCHVFHQDYVLKKGADADAVKSLLLDLVDRRGGEYPAEHNVGHLYSAKPALNAFYRSLDPTNSFNPGIGKAPVGRDWA